MKGLFSRFGLFTFIILSTSGMAGEAHSIYLPIIVNQPLVELVVTIPGEDGGYSTPWRVNGYVNSLVSKPVYSVSIEIEFTFYGYCGPDIDPCEVYEVTEIAYPAFPATLPGQINPFSWFVIQAKSSYYLRQVKVVSGSLRNDSGMTYYPLTVLNWHREDKAVIGRIRNDSGNNLVGARIVVVSNECDWKEATLTSTGLEPGQETDFRLDYFYCEGEDVVVIGQGSSGP